ncbi:uncharacterized protein An04g07920 [Aspergillus niger]|uniref:Contig An04c0250, genomic contig n=2 Tax=Aspergillus niger TaxID=5061 RepID=A2QJQ8_ASPNC|nr:uncharacterized protein An04g07920 [Aspergillus niger]CAK47949.1 unnamed protein product [Aspergillus niger]
MPRCPGVVRVPQVNTTLCDGVNEGRGPLTTGQTFDRSGRANTPRRLDPQQSRLLQTSTITVSRLVNHTRYIRSGSSTRLVVIGNAKVRTAGGHPRKHPADRQSQYRFRPTIYPKTGARNAFFPAASVIPSTPIYGWHQRLRSPADLPEEEDPAAMTATLPAMTTMPDIWTTQGDGGGLFDNDHGIAPGSGDFTQLLQF